MVLASQLRVGAVVRFEGQDYKVIGTEYRPGQGRMSGAMHARLRNLDTGTIWEHAFRSELKLEEMPLDKHTLEFLYADENLCCFMDPDNFEQTGMSTWRTTSCSHEPWNWNGAPVRAAMAGAEASEAMLG